VNGRSIDGVPRTFAPSGWLYESIFVLWDYETSSLWYPVDCQCGPTGATGLVSEEDLTQFRCISGKHADRVLPAIPHSQIPWVDWLLEHPGTLIMDPGSTNGRPVVD